ncbi:MAG: AI-2E family transporter [Acidobacteriota bacterium]|nr:AI-2E family transporter [Acidobacteriota bacterium]
MAGNELQLRIPFTTLMKIALAILLVVVVIKLWPVILMILIAIVIAVLIDPIPTWLERHGVRPTVSVIALAFVVFGLLIAFVILIVPSVSGQVSELTKEWPEVEHRLLRAFPPLGSVMQSLKGGAPQTRAWLARGMTAGKFAIEGTTTVVLVLVLAIYFVLEGRGAFAWLIDFAPKDKRGRIERTAEEIRAVVMAYMRGSIITAALAGIYVFIVLSILRVPLALLLGVLAFLFDFIPVVGTIVMAGVASLFGLLVSPGRALAVAAAILAYHAIEAYVLIPRIWGKQMRVSTLTVLLGITIGGVLQGPIGAVLALPIAAAYPIVERIWLREHLPSDTVDRHEEMEQTET